MSWDLERKKQKKRARLGLAGKRRFTPLKKRDAVWTRNARRRRASRGGGRAYSQYIGWRVVSTRLSVVSRNDSDTRESRNDEAQLTWLSTQQHFGSSKAPKPVHPFSKFNGIPNRIQKSDAEDARRALDDGGVLGGAAHQSAVHVRLAVQRAQHLSRILFFFFLATREQTLDLN